MLFQKKIFTYTEKERWDGSSSFLPVSQSCLELGTAVGVVGHKRCRALAWCRVGSDLLSPVWGRAPHGQGPGAGVKRERGCCGAGCIWASATTTNTCGGDGFALGLLLLPCLYRPVHLQLCKALSGETGLISATGCSSEPPL